MAQRTIVKIEDEKLGTVGTLEARTLQALENNPAGLKYAYGEDIDLDEFSEALPSGGRSNRLPLLNRLIKDGHVQKKRLPSGGHLYKITQAGIEALILLRLIKAKINLRKPA